MSHELVHYRRCNPSRIITPEDEKLIVDSYKDGISAKRILDLLGNKVKTTKTVYDVLRKWEVPRKDGPSSYNPITHDYFSNINSREKAYLLGFLVADGWIHPPKNQIGLCLASEDLWVIELLKSETGSAANVVTRPPVEKKFKTYTSITSTHYQLIMTSKKMVEDLSSLGVYAQKSCREILPIVPNEFQSHLLRGELDGDGTIYLHSNEKNTCIRFLGGGHITAQISLYLHLTLGVTYSFPVPKKNCPQLFHVEWSKEIDCEKIGRYLYQNSNNLRVLRKYEKAKSLID